MNTKFSNDAVLKKSIKKKLQQNDQILDGAAFDAMNMSTFVGEDDDNDDSNDDEVREEQVDMDDDDDDDEQENEETSDDEKKNDDDDDEDEDPFEFKGTDDDGDDDVSPQKKDGIDMRKIFTTCREYYMNEADTSIKKREREGPLVLRNMIADKIAEILQHCVQEETRELVRCINSCENVTYSKHFIGNNKAKTGPDSTIKCYLKRNKKVCFVKRTEVIKCTFTRDIYKDYCCALALSLEAKNAPPYVHPGTFDEFNARVEKETTTNVDNKFTVFENELLENSPELVQVLKEQSFNVETGKDRFAVNCLVELVNVDARFVAADFDVDFELERFDRLLKCIEAFWLAKNNFI